MSERFFLPTCQPEQVLLYIKAIEKASPIETHRFTIHDWAGQVIDMHLSAQGDGEMLLHLLGACRDDMFAEIRRAEIVVFRDKERLADDIGRHIRFCVNVGLRFIQDTVIHHLERHGSAAN